MCELLQGTDDDKDAVDTATKITIIFVTKIVNTTEKYIDDTTEVVRQISSVNDDAVELAPNASQLVSPVKGFRRSIRNKEVDSDNSLLLKIMDDRGKPRLEILIGNDDGDTMKKVGKKNRLPRSKTKSKFYMFVKGDNNTIHDKAEFRPTVIKVMPNNSLVVDEPDDIIGYPNGGSYNATVDLMEGKFISTNISKKVLDINNSIHEVEDNFTNFKNNSKYLNNPYTIKVRFDNKTEILRNKSTIYKLKQNITNSVNLAAPDIIDKYRNIFRIKINATTSANLPKHNITEESNT